MLKIRSWMLVALIAYSVLMRLVPYILFQFGLSIDPETTIYPWNFSPLPAICLFGGAMYAQRKYAFLIPLAAWIVADLGVWALTGKAEWAFYPAIGFVYGSVALTVVAGLVIRKRKRVETVAVAGLSSALLFYVVTNFGTWATGGGMYYPMTLEGLTQCYVAGIPFFRNSLISMAVFSGVLFSPIVLHLAATDEQPAPVPA
ncbi:MAG: hypothetical protein CMJ48_03095 [Planctomycetaceae bacterium]|nr:hypothetical protein [Planctomycetaceae bacterium]